MFCSPEIRRPKPERRPKSEFREWSNSIGCCSAGVAINSDLGLRVSFGPRVSGLEWPGPTLEQPWAGPPLIVVKLVFLGQLPTDDSLRIPPRT